jgi:hypothetical protein
MPGVGVGFPTNQGCQMFFLNQNTILGKIRGALEWKMMIYFINIWNILRPFNIFYDHLEYFVVIWYTFPVLVGLHLEKIWQPCHQLEHT